MKRVCVIHHVNRLGGGSKSLIDVLEMLKETVEVIACIPKGESELKEELIKRDIQIYEVQSPIASFPYYSGSSHLLSKVMMKSVAKMKYVRQLVSEIEQLSPDIVLCNTIVTCVLGPYFSNNIKKICIVRETFNRTILDGIYRKILNENFDGVCFIAKHEMDYIELDKNIKQMLLPDCVDPKIILPDKDTYTEKFQLLYEGGFPRLKGLDVILKAMYLLEDTPIRLKIAGYFSEKMISNKELLKLHSFAQWYYILKVRYYYYKLKNKGKIEVLGYRTDIDDEINDSDIIVFPSTKPHQPRPAIEAGEYYKPVIITDFEATQEYFIDGYNCLTFRCGDSKELAEKIMMLYQNNEMRNTLGKNNYKMTRMHHSYTKTQLSLCEFIENI